MAGTFGFGLLNFVNSTHAHYNWARVACQSTNASALHEVLDDVESCRTRTSRLATRPAQLPRSQGRGAATTLGP